MTHSMTAFSRQEISNEHGQFSCELRSVNHRYLDLSMHLSEDLRLLEPKIREHLQQRLRRGKVNMSLRFSPKPHAQNALTINRPLLQQLMQAAEQIQQDMPQAAMPSITDLLSWPDLLSVPQHDMVAIQGHVFKLLQMALDELIQIRAREGQQLAQLVEQRLVAMQEQVKKVKQSMPAVLIGVRERLVKRLQEVSEQLDQERLEQEMVILAQRLDVAEEMDRLDTHLTEVKRTLQKSEPTGRRLDFLMQELHREANTLGAKSVDSQTTAASIEMKVLIEQMREQIQNVE